MLVLTRQPTVHRENMSITKATYSQPCQVETYVESLPHRLVLVARNRVSP